MNMKHTLCALILCLVSNHVAINASDDGSSKIKKARKTARVSPVNKENSSTPGTLQCTKCDYSVSFQKKANLDRHMLNVHNLSAFVCSRVDCNKGFTSQALLKAHILQGHHVSKKALAQYVMVDSRDAAGNRDDLKCPDCHATFSRQWRGNFNRHLRNWHNIKPFFCMKNGCLKNFAADAELQAHTKICNKVKTQSPSAVVSLVQASQAPLQAIDMTIDAIAPSLDSFDYTGLASNPSTLNMSSLSQLDLVSDSLLGLD